MLHATEISVGSDYVRVCYENPIFVGVTSGEETVDFRGKQVVFKMANDAEAVESALVSEKRLRELDANCARAAMNIDHAAWCAGVISAAVGLGFAALWIGARVARLLNW